MYSNIRKLLYTKLKKFEIIKPTSCQISLKNDATAKDTVNIVPPQIKTDEDPKGKKGTTPDKSSESTNTKTTDSTTKKDSEMSAWIVKSVGGANRLELDNVKLPVIKKPREVLLKVLASSVNPIDVAMLHGYGSTILGTLRNIEGFGQNTPFGPLILGRDFTGKVVSKGNNVRSDIMIGDTLYGVIPPHLQGCHAEYVAVDDFLLCRKPEHVGVAEAAGILYTGLTAWCALKVSGDFLLMSPKKKRVLVIGSSGGVGIMAVQLLKAWEAEVVATCQEDAIPLVKKFNPDVVIDYMKSDAINQIAQAGKYDLVLDASGSANPDTYTPLLKEWANAKFIALRSPLLDNTDQHGLIYGMVRTVADFVASNVKSKAPTKGATVRWAFFMPIGIGITEIANLVDAKKVVPVIGEKYKYHQMLDAYEKVRAGHLRGKVIVEMP